MTTCAADKMYCICSGIVGGSQFFKEVSAAFQRLVLRVPWAL